MYCPKAGFTSLMLGFEKKQELRIKVKMEVRIVAKESRMWRFMDVIFIQRCSEKAGR
jgi:hypothetical protein